MESTTSDMSRASVSICDEESQSRWSQETEVESLVVPVPDESGCTTSTGISSSRNVAKRTTRACQRQKRHNVDVVDTDLNEDDVDVAEMVIEYEWPLDSGKFYFIEEYLSNFLNIKSLRRTYPQIERRRVQNVEEREHLLTEEVVTELQCDLGVIALKSGDVYQHVAPDFEAKFASYRRSLLVKDYKRTIETIVSRKITFDVSSVSSEQIKEMTMKSCAKWNIGIGNNMRKFPQYFDTQTGVIQRKRIDRPMLPYRTIGFNLVSSCQDYDHKLGYFPVALLPHHYVDHWRRYTSEELKTVPLNTVLQFPHSRHNYDMSLKGSYSSNSNVNAKPKCINLLRRKNIRPHVSKTNATETLDLATKINVKSMKTNRRKKTGDSGDTSESISNSSEGTLFEMVVKRPRSRLLTKKRTC